MNDRDQSRTWVPVVTPLSAVQPKPIRWIWPGRLAVGKLTLLDGDPGAGKSWLSEAIATCVAHGAPFPGSEHRRPPDRVLMIANEDGIDDTIRPRFDQMGADVSRIEVIEGMAHQEGGNPSDQTRRHFWLTEDLHAVESLLHSGLYGLLIIDPLNAYIPAGVNTDKDNAVRSVLAPLIELASREHVCVLCVRHLTKGSRDKAIYRGQGSIAYTAAARIVLIAGQDPKDPTGTRRHVIPIKCNLAPIAPAVSFEIRNGRFAWGGVTNGTAEELLAPDAPPEDRSALQEAMGWLGDLLADGPMAAKEVYEAAAKAGISKMTLKRARYQLQVRTQRHGFGPGSTLKWYAPRATESENRLREEMPQDPAQPSRDPLGASIGDQNPIETSMNSMRSLVPMGPARAEHFENPLHGEWWSSIAEEGPPEDDLE